MNRITPFLWFDQNAEEAAEFYLAIFPDGKRLGELRAGEAGPGPVGSVVTIAFELAGQPFTALNGGPAHTFNEGVSFVVSCKSQEELDRYWTALLAGGGSAIACGWLKDKFGLRWQVVPENISELLRPPAAMQAMMQMTKLDIAALEEAGQR